MNSDKSENEIRIAFMNIRGQSGFTSTKELQIESFLLQEKIDILNLQEINITDESFMSCDKVFSSYNIISNK